MLMDPLVLYYIHQACRGTHDGIGPIYTAPHFLQWSYEMAFFWQGYGEWLDRPSGLVQKLWGERLYLPVAISLQTLPDRRTKSLGI